jgi:hypothetical protein
MLEQFLEPKSDREMVVAGFRLLALSVIAAPLVLARAGLHSLVAASDAFSPQGRDAVKPAARRAPIQGFNFSP